jgi:hypothetical protein
MGDPAPSRHLAGDAVLREPLVRELLGARLAAVFATFDRSGTIHAVPMWFALRRGFRAAGDRLPQEGRESRG